MLGILSHSCLREPGSHTVKRHTLRPILILWHIMLNYTFKGMQGRVSILAVETDNTDRNSLIITIPLQTIRHILQIKNKHLRIDKHKENKPNIKCVSFLKFDNSIDTVGSYKFWTFFSRSQWRACKFYVCRLIRVR